MKLPILVLACLAALESGCTSSKPSTATSIDGVEIAFEKQGCGDVAIVLIHGLMIDRSYWKEQVEYLSDKYTVVAMDMVGHGESGSNRKEWSVEKNGDDIIAVIDELDLERVVVVGHSSGGEASLEAMIKGDPRIIGMIGVDIYKKLPFVLDEAAFEKWLVKLEANFEERMDQNVRKNLFPEDADPEIVDKVAEDMSSFPPARHTAMSKVGVPRYAKAHELLEKADKPIHLINAKYQPTDEASLLAFKPDLVFHYIQKEGVGHYPMLESPEEMSELIEKAVLEIANL